MRRIARRIGSLVLGALMVSARVAAAAPEQVEELVRNALQQDADVARGGAIYRKQCVNCHGVQAHGYSAGDIPSLAGQRQAYIVKQLADFSALEGASADVHAVVPRSAISKPQDWIDLATYLNGLTPTENPQRGAGKYVQLGQTIFREHCSSCHGEDARGKDQGFVPSLRNQHYTYLLNEMRTIARWHTRNFDEDLARFFDTLDEDELVGLADYLSRQHGD